MEKGNPHTVTDGVREKTGQRNELHKDEKYDCSDDVEKQMNDRDLLGSFRCAC